MTDSASDSATDSAASADTVAEIRRALAGVVDPELHASIVDLGMVRDVRLEDGTATVEVALTTAACPLRGQIGDEVRVRVAAVPGVDDVRVSYAEMTQEQRSAVMQRARLEATRRAPETAVPAETRVLAIASGKGGVGKSSVTVNLAAALATRGLTVGVVDADIWGFSVPRMLGVSGRLEATKGDDGRGRIVPGSLEVENRLDAGGAPGRIKVVSMGLLVDDEDTALMWRGLILSKALEQFLVDVEWGDMDYLLLDMPPGTGDIQMGIARMLPQAEMLLVTTPQAVAFKVAVRAANMARRSHMKVAGVVENMSSFTCEHGTTYEIFGHGGGEQLAGELDVPLIAQIPLDPQSVAAGDAGVPVTTAHPDSAAAAAYRRLAEEVTQEILPPVEMEGCTARIENIFENIG